MTDRVRPYTIRVDGVVYYRGTGDDHAIAAAARFVREHTAPGCVVTVDYGANPRDPFKRKVDLR